MTVSVEVIVDLSQRVELTYGPENKDKIALMWPKEGPVCATFVKYN